MALTKVTGQVIKNTTDVTVGVLTVTNTLAVGGTVSIGGTLTYEDVTNVDAVGLITARNGIVVGSGITLSKDGDIFATGVTTATTFVGAVTGNVTGNATGLTGTPNISAGTIAGSTGTFTGDVDIADKIVHTGDTNTAIRFPAADTFSVETAGSTRLHIHSDGRFRVGTTSQPSGTVGGFQLDMGSYPGTMRLMSGAGASATGESAGISVGGSNHNADITNGNNYGANLNLYNYNSTDGNSSAVSFMNSNGLSASRVVGNNASHSSRTGNLVFLTASGSSPTEKMRITSGGRLGLGVNSPDELLHLKSTASAGACIELDNNGNYKSQIKTNSDSMEIRAPQVMNFYTGNNDGASSTHRVRLTQTGKLLVGGISHNSTIASGVGSQLQIDGTTYATSGIALINNEASTDPAFLVFGKSRAGSNGGTTVVQNGDRLGSIRFAGADGTDLHSYAAEISCVVNGTPGSNDMPGSLLFGTTADGAASPTTRVQIQADGKIFVGTDTTNQDGNIFNIVGDKNISGGIVQGQLAVADNSAYNVTDNGGGIGFQAKFNNAGAYTQMGSIEGNKLNNTDGNYEGRLSFKVRNNLGNSVEYVSIETTRSRFTNSLTTESEFNMTRDDGTPTSKYMDMGYLNNTFHIRRTNGGDGGHTVHMTISSAGVISGNLNNTSDEKLKDNIVSIADGSLALVKQLRPVTFDWKDSTSGNDEVGFIAQEVKALIPNLINGTEYDETKVNEKGQIISTGYSINTTGVVAHLTKALQELITKVETLETKVAALEG